ncbi:hypothetical protein ACHAXT_004322 [Thalassiosira profunda]
MSERRVIFPWRHSLSPSALQRPSSSGQSSQEQPRSVKDDGRRERSTSIDLSKDLPKSIEFSPSPTTVASTFKNDGMRPTLCRANSLDGIPVPLPKLPVPGDKKTSKVIPPRTNSQSPFGSITIKDIPLAAQKARARPAPSPPPVETKSSKPQFIGDRRHRTYYPAASLPTSVSSEKMKSPSPAKPACSILRRKESGLGKPPSFDLGEATTQPSACLSPSVPTLASPASIKHLHHTRSDSDGQDSLGESLNDLERLSDDPKVLPRSARCKLRRPQSDTIIANEEEQCSRRNSTASIAQESYSRHESLECIGTNKRTSFDAHVKVYEFNVDSYERKGGEKWWTEDELARFKEEAIHRIRLRSMQIIPTGTGRAMAVTHVSKDKPSGGSVMFNHPALGCDDEPDPEMATAAKDASSQQNARSLIAASSEIKSILVVDPHHIFLSLFTRSLKRMMPHASVATAQSAEEAVARIEAAQKAFPLSDGGCINGFDMIIVEQRLRESFFAVQQLASGAQAAASLTQQNISTQTAGDDSAQRRWSMASGSTLIHHLVEMEEKSISGRRSLLIGVSARLSLDEDKLKRSGADVIWGKPPPEMDVALRNELLNLLANKRNR